ncbi:MAG: sulfurtransferase [Propionicimonas sp.]
MTHDSARARVLVTVPELQATLAVGAAAGPQLLDVRWQLTEPQGAGFERFLAGHLPGARFVDLETVLTGPTSDPRLGRHPLPDAQRLAVGLAEAGVDVQRPLVVYDEPGSFAAGRAWWVLRDAGLDARVLDGGITAWLAAGGSLESGAAEPVEPVLQPAGLTLVHLPQLDADEVASFDGIVVDVRAPQRFRGEVEPLDPRAGHLPGAVNRPVGDFFAADGTLPDAATLTGLLALPSGVPVAVYCGSGVSAAQVVLAAATLGVTCALYPPSWSGWSSDPSRPVELGA